MTSPRKFAEKIALIQQKQAEGDVAFKTIICEVGEAKQRVSRVSATKGKLDVPVRTYEKPFENYQGSTNSNGMNNNETNHSPNYLSQTMKMDNGNDCDRLLQLPDNGSWRRTNSDSSLHYALMPAVVAHYHANNGQGGAYDSNEMKFEPSTSPSNLHPFQVSNPPFPTHPTFDPAHSINQSYIPDRSHPIYPSNPMPPLVPLAPTQSVPVASSNPPHAMLGPRYSGGSTGSNVLMLPPAHHPRGGSLPDLRTGNVFSPQQPVSFSTTPSPPTSSNQAFFSTCLPQKNGEGDIYVLGPQQQLTSTIGPLKPSPSIRRRHSPIGEVKQPSPRRQNSPSPDVSPNPQSIYRVEPSSPQSQSSYSPQNSPHLLASPGNDHNPFSPQQSNEQSGNNQQPYFTLSAHLDQITLDPNFYTPQPSSSSPTPTSQAANHHHPSSPTRPRNSLPNDMNGMHSTYFRPNNFYPTFMDNMTSTAYSQTQTSVTMTGVGQKSPTIPNIILTDVDSSKLDLSKDLTNDFCGAFDSLMDPTDLQLNNDVFLLNESDLAIDSHLCDGTFRMEN